MRLRLILLMAPLAVVQCAAPSAPPPATPIKPCAAGLSPPARKIYDAVMAGPQQGILRDRIATQTRDLVMEGDMPRSKARPAAEEAADCLKAPS